jgi:hypothetical protein
MTKGTELPTYDLTGRRVRPAVGQPALNLDPEPSPLLEAIRRYLEGRG